ncbi:hypothetical protein VCHC48A1_2671, partial [Vibrio cholerae HC-48A1]
MAVMPCPLSIYSVKSRYSVKKHNTHFSHPDKAENRNKKAGLA